MAKLSTKNEISHLSNKKTEIYSSRLRRNLLFSNEYETTRSDFEDTADLKAQFGVISADEMEKYDGVFASIFDRHSVRIALVSSYYRMCPETSLWCESLTAKLKKFDPPSCNPLQSVASIKTQKTGSR